MRPAHEQLGCTSSRPKTDSHVLIAIELAKAMMVCFQRLFEQLIAAQ
jgi:hypothetical protein